MREWKNQFSPRSRFKSNSGSRERVLYGAVFDDSGRIFLEEKGKESIYDLIQSFADSVDIHVILKRFANGEVDVLSKVQGFYGDFTSLPNNYAQLLNTINDGQRLFESLPVDIRAKFSHNFNEFMTCLCDGSLFDRIGLEASPSPLPSDDFTPSPSVDK